MKKFNLFLKLTLVWLMLSGLKTSAQQLNGIYTIDSTQTTGGRNFQTFKDAIDTLKAYGIDSAVVFHVAKGTYNERVQIDAISGVSPVNTITFDGGADSANTRIITFNGPVSATRATVQINGCPYVTLRNLTIRTTGTSQGWGVHITSTSNAAKIKNCIINIGGGGITSSDIVAYNGIVVSGSATSQTTGIGIDSLEIDSNTINYGGHGIVHYGTTSDTASNNKFRYNTINNSYTNGIYLNYHDNAEISSNTITLRTGATSSRGIYLQNSVSVGSNYTRINGNRIINPGGYGILLSGSSNYGISKGIIANNAIGGGFQGSSPYGMRLDNSERWNIYHNSINKDIMSSIGLRAGMYLNASCRYITIYNNIFAITGIQGGGSGRSIPLVIIDTLAVDSMDYNIFYTVNSGDLIGLNGIYFDANNFKGIAGFNANSVVGANLSFTSNTYLNFTGGCNDKGIYLNSIPTDINGTSRNNPPDIGAYEYSGVDNISIDGFIRPATEGLQDLVVRVKNTGSNSVNSFTVSYVLDNGTEVSKQWSTGTLAPCDTVSIPFSGINFLAGSLYELTVYTSQPNGNIDTEKSNDTLKTLLAVPLSGIYTIGDTSTGASFVSFNAAVTALVNSGVSGAVTFNVQSGIYTEQVVIPAITGASATNTITFQSAVKHADSAILNYAAATQIPIVQFSHSKYINFKYITVSSTTTTGRAFELVGTASYDSIIYCKISAGNMGIIATQLSVGKNVFGWNTITGSDRGIGMYQITTSNTIIGNTIYTSLYGIDLNIASNLLIVNNHIILTENNFGTSAGILHVTGSKNRFYHNTISATGGGILGCIFITYNNAADSANEWKNNVVAPNTSPVIHSTTNITGINNIWDYNLYYTNGTLIRYSGTNTTLADWQAFGQDKHSFVYRPAFIDSINHQPNPSDSTSWAINGRGIFLDTAFAAVIGTDINGNPRPLKREDGVPDLGANEFTPTVAPPLATATGSIAADSVQIFTSPFNSLDTVAKIKWNAGPFNLPAKVEVRQYVGVPAPGITDSEKFTYFYTSIQDSGTGGYNFDADIYYKDAWLGTVPNESNLTLIRHDQSGSGWGLVADNSPSVVTDSVQNVISVKSYANFGLYTGTDRYNPLPVQLLSIKATAVKNDVLLTWSTASEVNSGYFEVERLVNGNQWSVIGKREAKGNSSSINNYQFTDQSPFTNHQSLYYRLKIVDNDGSYEYSKVVSVNRQQPTTNNQQLLSVYPNPFSNNVNVEFVSESEGIANISLVDITGRDVQLNVSKQIAKGNNILNIDTDKLNKGIYFLSVELNSETQVVKLIKQ